MVKQEGEGLGWGFGYRVQGLGGADQSGIQTRLARARDGYPNQLEYNGFWHVCFAASHDSNWLCGLVA